MKNTFMYRDSLLPTYMQYPDFLIQVPISQTAKLIYMVLYNRARLSLRNDWTDDEGKVYIYYPIKELARDVKKGVTTVKDVLIELEQQQLLVRCSGGFGKPNLLYVLYTPESRNFDSVGNVTAREPKNCPAESRFSGSKTAGFPPPNKVNNKRNRVRGFQEYSCEEGESL